MWTCPHCGEEHDPSFDVCWNCGSDRSGQKDPGFQPVDEDREVPDPCFESSNTQVSEVPAGDRRRAAATIGGRADPSAALRPAGDDKSLVSVGFFLYPVQAWVARNALVAAGISAAVVDEHVPNMCWLYSQAIGGVKLLIRSADLAKAEEVLAEDRSGLLGPPSRDAPGVVCPACGSTEIVQERYWRPAVYLVWLLFGFPLPIRLPTVRCLGCGWREGKPIEGTFRIPTQFTIRHMLILTFLTAVFLSISKMIGADWLSDLGAAMTPRPKIPP